MADGINRFVVNGIDSFVPDSIQLKEGVVQYGLRSGDGTWINIRDHRPIDEAKVVRAGNALVAYRQARKNLECAVSVSRSMKKGKAKDALLAAMTDLLGNPAFVRIVPTQVEKNGVQVEYKTVNLYTLTPDGANPYATMSVTRECPNGECMFKLQVGDERPVWVVITRWEAPAEEPAEAYPDEKLMNELAKVPAKVSA